MFSDSASDGPALPLAWLRAPEALHLPASAAGSDGSQAAGPASPGAGRAQNASITVPTPSLPDGSSLTLGCTGVEDFSSDSVEAPPEFRIQKVWVGA